MTPEARTKLKGLLLKHESYRQFPYVDTTGHLTIACGRNLTDRGISTTEAYFLLDEDILYFTSRLSGSLDFFNDIDEARQIVLIDMCFNLGINGLLGFKRMLAALKSGNYSLAAKEMLSSKWAKQVGHRAIELAAIMESGEMP